MSEKAILESTIFWICAALSLACGLGVVLHRSIIYAALFLIVVFMSIAGLFVLNNADFLAIAQVIVYGVGLTIVLIFGVMFTGDKPFSEPVSKSQRWANNFVVGLTALVLFSGVLLVFVGRSRPNMPMWLHQASADTINQLMTVGSTPKLGQLLFSKYVLPFEIASILLLVAMMGAIILSKKTLTTEDESLITASTKFEVNPESEVPAEAEALLKQQAALKAPEPEAPSASSENQEGDSSPESPELAGVK